MTDANNIEEIGIPKANRVTRRYTMTEAALQQRREAAKQPKPGMQGIRNGWKHGMYAKSFLTKLKPCKSTCEKYPCSLIAEGATEPGGDCLDVAELLYVVRAIRDAMRDPANSDDFQEVAALNIANSIKILEMLQEDVFRDGTIIKSEKITKDGTQTEYTLHPALLALPKMIRDLNMHPAEYMITPKAQAKQQSEDEAAKTLTDIIAEAGRRLSGVKEKT